MNIISHLTPFLHPAGLTPLQIEQVRAYLDLLLKWNEKTNLTSVRQPAEIISRHFGESFFLASSLAQVRTPAAASTENQFIDVGSGAALPGIPLKIYFPHLKRTLLESLNTK